MRLALGLFLASTSRGAIAGATVTTFDSSTVRFDSTSYTFDRSI